MQKVNTVTILVLVEKPLQYVKCQTKCIISLSHNPCFSGKTFAISRTKRLNMPLKGHNPCFSGKTFAINVSYACFLEFKKSQSLFQWKNLCNMSCKGINCAEYESQSLFQWKNLCNVFTSKRREEIELVTILVLVEKPLQYAKFNKSSVDAWVTILVLVEKPLQFN